MEDITLFQDIYREPLPDQGQVGQDLFSLISPVEKSEEETPYNPYPTLKDISGIVTVPAKAIAGGVSTIYEGVTGTVKNAYLYLVGGVVLIGIISVVVLFAGTRFLGKLEGA